MWDFTGNFDTAIAVYWLDFTRPWALTCLAAVAIIVWLSARSLVAASKFRKIFSALLRIFALVSLVLALAGARLVRQSELLCLNILVDQSASIDPDARQKVLNQLAIQFRAMQAEHRAAIMGFAAQGQLQQLATNEPVITPMQGDFHPEFTDIGRALRLAISTSMPEASNRILLITDGRDSVSDSTAESAAAAARASGIPVDVLALDSPVGGDVRIERLSVAPQVRSEERFDLRSVIYSDSDRNARLLLYRRGSAVDISGGNGDDIARTIRLKKGYNLIDVASEKISSGGFYDYELFIEPAGSDKIAANNSASAVVRVAGRSGTVIVDGSENGRQGANLAAAIGSSGMDSVVVSPSEMPSTLLDMESISTLVLSDVPADALSDAQMDIIRNWVHSGGGFVWVGGVDSFGPGGYSRTPIEEISPVSCDVKRYIERASLALAIMIDQSSSMGAPVSGGNTKMDLANNAAAAAVNMLDSRDQAGVAMVDTAYKWITSPHVQHMNSANQSNLVRRVLANKPGGGGIFCLTALRAAYDELKNINAASKHILLFADTEDSEQQEGCVELVRKAVSQGMTVSAVGLGLPRPENDARFLERVAQAGKGRIYFTDDPHKLPRVFMRDVSIASRNAFIEPENGILPAIVAAGEGVGDPILRGLPAPPKLRGQVATTIKPRARLLMYGHKAEDALLARWNFGLGKSVAWTSDAVGHWAGNWVSWEAFGQFWTQVIRWAQRSSNLDSPVSTWTSISGDTGRIIAEAVDADGNSLTGMDLRAVVQSSEPGQSPVEITLRQSAPGRYEGQFPVDKRGAYVVTVVDSEDNPLDAAAAALSYSPEFASSGADTASIEKIAAAGGGRVLTELTDLFVRPDEPSKTFRPITQHLLAWGLFLFFMDIVVRRLVLPQWLVKYFATGRKYQQPATQTDRTARTNMQNAKSPVRVSVDTNAAASLADATDDYDQSTGESDDNKSAVSRTKETGPRQVASAMSMSERLKAAKKRARNEIQDMQKEDD